MQGSDEIPGYCPPRRISSNAVSGRESQSLVSIRVHSCPFVVKNSFVKLRVVFGDPQILARRRDSGESWIHCRSTEHQRRKERIWKRTSKTWNTRTARWPASV